jgi:molybdopterin-guanine dinucleotide biosynthesis protein A
MDEREVRPAPSPPVVAVLAGGLARRMGGAKALVELAGRPLISYPLRAAAEAGLATIVVAKQDSELPPLRVPIVREPDGTRHPLCGVLAALGHADAGVLAVPCDMPFVSARLLAWLAGLGETVLIEVDGRAQPLPALYPSAAVPVLEQALARGDSLRATLELLRARPIAEQELRRFGDLRRLFFSVNDASDLRLAERWLREPQRPVEPPERRVLSRRRPR